MPKRLRQPRLLDLFCGAGGAGMGYARAGFEVVGVDIRPQPRYPFAFHQADALTFPLEGFDAVHTSAPCQAFTRLNARWQREYPNHIPAMRERLRAWGGLWVMENVPGAPFDYSVMLCGSMFGLRVLRHRVFETSMLVFSPGCCDHRKPHMIYGDRTSTQESAYRDAMDVSWMRAREDARQAIPPAYTEWIGRQLLAALEWQEVSA